MATPLRILMLFIFFFQAGFAFMTVAVIYPGILYNTTSTPVYVGGEYSGNNLSNTNIFDPRDDNSKPTSAWNLFGMGWVFGVLTFAYNIVANCTVNAPQFYTALFSFIDPISAATYGGIVGAMQAFAFSLGLASMVMRWNI
jgi:hypothetical protein